MGSSPNQTVNLQDAPGGELTFDQLFGDTSEGTPQTTAPQVASTPAAATTPAPSTEPSKSLEPFLKTPTGTVYNTAEEAVKGIAHKDAVIEQLRKQAIERTGVDPLTGQPVRKESSPSEPKSYLQDGKAYLNDLLAAAQKGDPDAYTATQYRFVGEAIQQVLGPVAPIIQQFAQTTALNAVEEKVKDFKHFRDSEDYKQTLEEIPELKEAIEFAERDVRFAGKLANLYRTAYLATLGRKMPDLVKTPAAATPTGVPTQAAPAPTTSVVRPTLTSTTNPPPPTSTVPPNLNTSEGRKALIAQLEAKGVKDFPM